MESNFGLCKTAT